MLDIDILRFCGAAMGLEGVVCTKASEPDSPYFATTSERFDPLNDSSDALLLALTLNMRLKVTGNLVWADVKDCHGDRIASVQDAEPDKLHGARRAISMAAAAVGMRNAELGE